MQFEYKNELIPFVESHIQGFTGFTKFQIAFLKKLQSSPKMAFVYGRQMGKTMLQQETIKHYYDFINAPTYTKTVFLTNGSYIFEIYGLLGKFKLRKIKGSWMATNVWYILKFLDRKKVNQQDIAEIEKQLFGVLT